MPDGKTMKNSDMKSAYKHGGATKKPAAKMNMGGMMAKKKSGAK
jgi:hypothetical protein